MSTHETYETLSEDEIIAISLAFSASYDENDGRASDSPIESDAALAVRLVAEEKRRRLENLDSDAAFALNLVRDEEDREFATELERLSLIESEQRRIVDEAIAASLQADADVDAFVERQEQLERDEQMARELSKDELATPHVVLNKPPARWSKAVRHPTSSASTRLRAAGQRDGALEFSSRRLAPSAYKVDDPIDRDKVIDLHGLTLDEARRATRECLLGYARDPHVRRVRVVVGKGTRIRPALRKELPEEFGHICTVREEQGCFLCRFR